MSKVIKVDLKRSLALTTRSQPDIVVFSLDEFQSMNLTGASIKINLKHLDKTVSWDMRDDLAASEVFNEIIEQLGQEG